MNSTGVEITAGLGGFLVLFGLMLTVWFLGRDMTRRLRRMQLTEDERVAEVRRQREERSAATQPGGGAGTGAGAEDPAGEEPGGDGEGGRPEPAAKNDTDDEDVEGDPIG